MTESALISQDEKAIQVPVRRGAEFEGGLLTPELVKEMETQVDLVRRMRLAVLKLTEASHWQDIAGTPHLKDGGIHAIASTIGVEFSEPRVTEDKGADEIGEYIHYRCQMSGRWRNRVLFEEGFGSTRDDFFAWSKQERVPFNEIPIGNVRKKSITNAQHRILCKITGLGGVTWDLLEKVGIKRGAGGSIRFRGSESKMATGAGVWTPEKEELWGLLVELCDGDPKAAEESLFKATDNVEKGFRGKRDVKALTDGQVKFHLPRIRAEWEKRNGEFPQAKDPLAGRQPGEES